MKNKVYLVTLETKLEGITEFDVLKVFSSMELATKYFDEERDRIVNDYTKDIEGFEIYNLTGTLFTYQRDDFEIYFELSITEKEIINN